MTQHELTLSLEDEELNFFVSYIVKELHGYARLANVIQAPTITHNVNLSQTSKQRGRKK